MADLMAWAVTLAHGTAQPRDSFRRTFSPTVTTVIRGGGDLPSSRIGINDSSVAVFALLAALVAVGAAYQVVSARRLAQRHALPGRLIDVGGHRLHAVCQGEGTPIVLLESGIAASSLSWTLVQPEIAKFTRVCAYDRAGLAWSDLAPSPRTFARTVQELRAVLMDIAPRGPYVLVGHSFGSFVVRACAAHFPSDVAGVVLVDPPTEWLVMTRERTRMLRGAVQLSRLGALLAHVGVVRVCLALLTGGAPGAPRRFVKIFGATAARTLEKLVGEVRKLPTEVHPIVLMHWCQPKCFHAMADHLSVLARDGGSMAALAPPQDVPLTVISSRDQPPEQIAAHRRLSEWSHRGRHVIATRSGHWIQFDEPDLIVDAIRELVELSRADGR
jgi:pimeloyl-ACP methyl ester carboxylesterase